MENIYWTWNKQQPSKQGKILASKDFELIDLNEKMDECWLHPLKYTHKIDFPYLYVF